MSGANNKGMSPKNQPNRIDELLNNVTEDLMTHVPQQFRDDALRVERLLLEVVRPDPVQPRRVLPEHLHFDFHAGRLTPTQALRGLVQLVQISARQRARPFTNMLELLPNPDAEEDDQSAALSPEEQLLDDLVNLAVTIRDDGQVNPLTVVDVSQGDGASATAAADPKLHALFTDFQEDIGALTAMAKQVIGELLAEHSTEQIRMAIKEAVIYEKRSLAYIRRVLHAWKHDGRATERGISSWSDTSVPKDQPILQESAPSLLIWPPPDLDDDLPAKPNLSDPAVAAWAAICEQLPDLGRLPRMVTPISLIGNVLTVSASDERTYLALTNTQRHCVDFALRKVLGASLLLRVEHVARASGAA